MIEGIFVEGLIFAIMALGILISYRILDLADLTCDGSVATGAAVATMCIVNGLGITVGLIMAFLVGVLTGLVTATIHNKLRIPGLLAGILTMTMLYSINLRIAGKSNLPIFSKDSIFSNPVVGRIFAGGLSFISNAAILLLIVLVLKLLLDAYLNTRSGYLLRAAGSNRKLVISLGKNDGMVRILGLALANGFAAFTGCIMAQKQGYFELSMGTGMMVIGLANVIIGTQLFSRLGGLKATTAVIAGAIIYRACVAAAINAGLEPGDMKLITAVLFLVIIAAGNLRKNRTARRARSC